MKKLFFVMVFVFLAAMVFSQSTNYKTPFYNNAPWNSSVDEIKEFEYVLINNKVKNKIVIENNETIVFETTNGIGGKETKHTFGYNLINNKLVMCYDYVTFHTSGTNSSSTYTPYQNLLYELNSIYGFVEKRDSFVFKQIFDNKDTYTWENSRTLFFNKGLISVRLFLDINKFEIIFLKPGITKEELEQVYFKNHVNYEFLIHLLYGN